MKCAVLSEGQPLIDAQAVAEVVVASEVRVEVRRAWKRGGWCEIKFREVMNVQRIRDKSEGEQASTD